MARSAQSLSRICGPGKSPMANKDCSNCLKVREGRLAVDSPKLCVFLNNTDISEHI